MKMIRKNQIGFLFVLFILVSGCAPQFQVKPAKENAWYDKMQLSALHTDHLSYHTSIFLHDYLLQDDYQKNPLQTLTDFDRSIGENLSRDNLLSLMGRDKTPTFRWKLQHRYCKMPPWVNIDMVRIRSLRSICMWCGSQNIENPCWKEKRHTGYGN